MDAKTYIAIDLKSYYASFECVARSLDPLTTCLVVADESRTDKTICLAVTPALKSFGIGGRGRLFEVKQKLKNINYERQRKAPGYRLIGYSSNIDEINNNPSLGVDFIAAPPQMAKYVETSSKIYDIYLKYIAPEDIHVYSIDEVFMDVSGYLNTYKMNAEELARTIIKDVYDNTGITATAGIGTNLFLAKVAMDIVAKKMKADKYGVRVAYLDEYSYREQIWEHQPITDIWRVGGGIARKLAAHGMHTMKDVAMCSLGGYEDYHNEDLLFKLFGVNAELLIDHAWGYEPCRMSDIKSYKSKANSLGSGQVLHQPYTYEKAKLVLIEMIDALSLDLVKKNLVTSQISLMIGYDIDNLKDDEIAAMYDGDVVVDYYGRVAPKPVHSSINLPFPTSSSKLLTEAILKLYAHITNKKLWIRRINISANNVVDMNKAKDQVVYEQLDLFTNYERVDELKEKQQKELDREYKLQCVMLDIKEKYGKNAILKGISLEEGATARERNNQIGGHKA